MITPSVIGFLTADAEVVDLNLADHRLTVTFSVASSIVRGSGDARKKFTTVHKITVHGESKYFAATLQKGDLVMVSDLTYTTSETVGKRQATYFVRADTLELLRRMPAPLRCRRQAELADFQLVAA